MANTNIFYGRNIVMEFCLEYQNNSYETWNIVLSLIEPVFRAAFMFYSEILESMFDNRNE